jgi:ATP-dependent RNA helicase DDX31/DBP7
MSDDGLMLNFAAPSSSALVRRASGKRHHERPRTSLNNGSGKTTGSTAPAPVPDAARNTSVPQASTSKEAINPTKGSIPASKERVSISEVSVTPPQRKEPVASTSQLPRPVTNIHVEKPNSAAPAAPRRSGFISSLFTGDDSNSKRFVQTSSKALLSNPTNAPSAGTPFGSLGLDPLLVAHLRSSKMSIEHPTNIQRNSLPFLLSPSNIGRDALLHAQTGSGKTLSYLLPIIQSLLPLCETSWIDRSCLGTLAIILAPTRELAHQIHEVAEKLCSLYLTARSAEGAVKQEENSEEEAGEEEVGESGGTRRTRWIIPGILSGGATRNHEKSRLRKGLPLIVATPGRLLDHLRNTGSLDVGRLQWLVLDEADRLLELGFEQTLSDIMKAIDGRRRAGCEVQRTRMKEEIGSQWQGQAIPDEEVMDSFGEMWWKNARRTVLCSATLDEGVQVLAGKSLINPKIIRGEADKNEEGVKSNGAVKQDLEKRTSTMTAPAQLKQNYLVMPTKQRLILLVALLRQAIASGKTKVMVFLNCTDSVDFHWSTLGGVKMSMDEKAKEDGSKETKASPLHLESDLLPDTSIFKLHGSLSQHERQNSLKQFTQCKQSAVLLCTSVASRGLDLDISMVVQLDPPSEKGVDEYLHRVGRTARVGEKGESWLLLLPSEEGCIEQYEEKMGKVKIIQRHDQDVWQTQARATEVQMAFEKWVLEDEKNANLARKAYLSHLRAYATHPPSERQYFSLSNLQLGHLAKAFALREAPGVIKSTYKSSSLKSLKAKDGTATIGTQQPGKKRKKQSTKGRDEDGNESSGTDEEQPLRKYMDFARNKESEAKMYAKVREMGKLNRKGGVLGAYGVQEYQIG